MHPSHAAAYYLAMTVRSWMVVEGTQYTDEEASVWSVTQVGRVPFLHAVHGTLWPSRCGSGHGRMSGEGASCVLISARSRIRLHVQQCGIWNPGLGVTREHGRAAVCARRGQLPVGGRCQNGRNKPCMTRIRSAVVCIEVMRQQGQFRVLKRW